MNRSLLLVMLAACSTPTRFLDAGTEVADAAGDAVVPRDALLIDAAVPDALPPDPFTELQTMPGLCTPDEWCWAFPTPTGNRWFKVFATAPDNIWLAGARGTVLQWNGQLWKSHTVPALPGQEFVRWIWNIGGRSANDMWLIVGSAVEHWNGATWTIFEAGPTTVANPYHSVWSAPNGDAFLTGQGGLKRSQNGGPFQVLLPGSNLTTVWGTAHDDLFVTSGSSVIHYDGQSFTTVYAQAGKNPGFFQGVKDDVWVSGPNNTLAHWNGTTMTPVATGRSANAWIDAAGYRASNDVWWMHGAVFMHWDGTSITSMPANLDSFGEFCCGGINSVQIINDRWWMVGGEGGVYTKIGPDAVSPIVSPQFIGSTMWGTSDDDMYFTGNGLEVRHWNGTTMTLLPIQLLAITGVAGTGVGGANELFSISQYNDEATYESVFSGYHFDGQTWTRTELSRYPASLLATIEPYHYRMRLVYPIGAGEAMAVGGKGHAYHYKNGTWNPIATGVTVDLNNVWGPDPDHLWITGDRGTLLMWDRSNPGVMTVDATLPSTTEDLGSIHGADGIMWVANAYTSYSTLVRKHTASGWSVADTGYQVYELFAISATNVVATTHFNGTVARWNGTEFVLEDFGYERAMDSVFRPPGGKTWISNGHGIMQHP